MLQNSRVGGVEKSMNFFFNFLSIHQLADKNKIQNLVLSSLRNKRFLPSDTFFYPAEKVDKKSVEKETEIKSIRKIRRIKNQQKKAQFDKILN